MIGDSGTKVPGLGVIVFKDGREVYSHFAGRRHIGASSGGKDEPVTRNTRFRVASVSKTVTGLAVMQLVQEGKIQLDEDISHYLGYSLRNPNAPTVPITVRMLLSHTSSLRDGRTYSLQPSVPIRDYFKPGTSYYHPSHFASKWQQPGTYFTYANINYGVLGTIIEKVTGERFDRYMKRHILTDLETEASFFPATLSPAAFKELGTVYRKTGEAAGTNLDLGFPKSMISGAASRALPLHQAATAFLATKSEPTGPSLRPKAVCVFPTKSSPMSCAFSSTREPSMANASFLPPLSVK